MRHLTTVLILALASTNASKYYQQFQQDPRESPYLAMALNEEQFVPLVEEAARWESPLDPRMILFNDLDSLENFLEEDPNEFRIKRTKTSLSIDNPLDVLRQQFFKAYARRMKNKFIEKNREHLLKTGKRSVQEVQFPLSLVRQQTDFQSQKDLRETDERDNNHGREQNPGTRRNQNRMEDVSYQT